MSAFTKRDLIDIRSNVKNAPAWTLLNFYIDETRAALDVELDSVTDIYEQQRVIGKRQVLKNLVTHFSHYLDNQIENTHE